MLRTELQWTGNKQRCYGFVKTGNTMQRKRCDKYGAAKAQLGPERPGKGTALP